MSQKSLTKQTPKQTGILIGIAGCVWFVSLVVICTMLTTVHEAIRVESGRGDSWWYAISAVLINPASIALCVCFALRLWKEYDIPDQRQEAHEHDWYNDGDVLRCYDCTDTREAEQ